jgi:DNA polymerase-3 subunit alpha
MAALMTSVMGDATSMANYIHNCREMGIEILPPDVNESSETFTVVYDEVDGRKVPKIRFGLLGVKNLGRGAIEAIIQAREEKGFPKDIFQFIDNLDIRRVNKKGIESLIKAGAMDSFDTNRAAHLVIHESLIESAQSQAKHNLEGQMSLFQTNSDTMSSSDRLSRLPEVSNFDEEMLMAQEKEMLGVYITAHPLDNYQDMIRDMATMDSARLAAVLDREEDGVSMEESGPAASEVTDGMKVTMAGIVTGRKNLVTKNNKMMAFVDLEDLLGTVEVVVFPNVFERYHDLIEEDRVIAITGTVNFKEGEVPKLLADRVVDLKEMKESRPKPQETGEKRPEGLVKIRMTEGSIAGDREGMLDRLQKLMADHPGAYQAIIYMPAAEGAKASSFRTGPELWFSPDEEF